MKILYGITANGNGHLTRSSRVVQQLRRRGHEVSVVVSGEPGKVIMDQQDLEPFLRFAGFSFAKHKGRVSIPATLMHSRPLRFLADLASGIPKDDYDLAVTDFEPVSAWYARLHHIHSAGLCHMYSFLYPEVPKPDSAWYERLAFRWLAPADIMLGIHWQPYHRHIIPPFVEPDNGETVESDLVLVYLPWEDPDSYLPALRLMPEYRFAVYGKREGREEHIQYKTQSKSGFQQDLNRSASVLANAGFALAGEALSKGKRLILKPFSGQVEQEHNAREAEAQGLASRIEFIEAGKLRSCLQKPACTGLNFPDMTPRFIEWLEQGAPLVDKYWHHRFWNQSIAPD